MAKARKRPDYMRVVEGATARKMQPAAAAAADQNSLPTPMPLADFTDPPHWMNERQRDLWKYAVKGVPEGVLKKTDASVFTAWVCACDLHAEAMQQVNRLGQMVKSPVQGVPMYNPFLAVVNKQATIMLKAAHEMGFTPRSRSSVKRDKKANRASSPFGDLKSLSDD